LSRIALFAPQGYDIAPDQDIGAGFSQQAPRFLFGFFLVRLVRVHRPRDGYGLHSIEMSQFVE
jgi:hypothetical protein